MSRRLLAGLCVLAAVLAPATAPAAAAAYRLEPFKDELFRYPAILQSEYGGDFLLVDYDRQRDLKDRDLVERYKVRPEYISLETDAVQREMELRAGNSRIRYTAVGATDGGAKAIVIFLHGRGADRTAGASDLIHGGNFNRIKNLMMRNGGLYISPDFSDFSRRGTAEMKALLLHQAHLSPGAPIFLACGSWGGRICWRLIDDGETGPLITGVLFMDSEMDTGFIAKAARLDPARRPAINISNTMEDRIVGYKPQLAFFRRLRAEVPGYPVRFVLFDSGTHGISLRMTDWRNVINWMLEAKGR